MSDETEFDENGQWAGTCCQCLTSHDGHPPGTFGGEVRCLVAQAEELGDPELVNKARDVLHHAAERRNEALAMVVISDGVWCDPCRLAVLKIVGADSRRAEEVAIVRDLAAERWPMAGEEHHCMLCGAYRGLNPEDHAESCPWRRAKELLANE